NTKEFVNVKPGSYTITESAADDWNLTALACTVTGSASATPDKDNRKASITISGDSTVECKFTNTAVPARLTVIKTVVNNDGGDAEASDFPITVAGTNVSNATFDGAESPGVTVTLDKGSYGVTEDVNAVPGFAGTYGSGCSGTVDWGDEKTCLITNNDAPPGLTVIKHVVNDDGGTKQADDFSITVTGGNPSPASFSGDEDGTEVSINAGSYSVSEGTVEGYAPSYSSDCTGSISLGQSKVCTITNDDIQPKLTVIKTVVNDNGGTMQADDFSITVDGDNASPSGFSGDEEGTEVALDAGEYEVTEDEDDGYAASYSSDCTGSIALGETKTCTIINDDIPPKLTVKKLVVNDNGGTASPGDFTLVVDGNSASPGSFAGSEAGTVVALDAGSYSVGESGDEGYIAGYSQDCDGTIDIGEELVCTVTNDDAPPGLTVVKRVINDNGGTLHADDFTIDVEGDNADPGSFAGDAEGTHVDIDAGAYEVTEREADGYEVSYSPECEGTIGLGETVVCTVTNDDIPPVLTVVKNVVNDSGGTKTASDFTLAVEVEGPDPASFPGSSSGTQVTLAAGEYKVTETKVTGYTGSFSADCTGSIEIGEEKTCIVTNNDDPPVEVLGEVVTNPIVVLGIELPRTGMTYALYLAIGLFLLAAGAYLLRLSPRRQSAG
ncbi:MAG: prealbumin-like fold domain-containing protein, partial [Actinomycetota bacterium]